MSKIRLVVLVILIIVMSIIIYYINGRISAYDLRFYSGKDDGAFVRLESIVIMSSFFYLFMSKKYRIIQFIGGFFIGLLSGIIGYILVGLLLYRVFSDFGLTFHILGCIIFMVIFFLIERLVESRSTKATRLVK